MIPNTWLRVGSRMWNSTYYDPSVVDARFPLAGQNQSFCPVNEQAASHGYLPPLSLQESQADSNNRLNRAIQRKRQFRGMTLRLGLRTICIRLSAVDMPVDAPNSSHLHPIMTAVMMLDVTFATLLGILMWSILDTFHPDFEHVEGGSGDSGQPTYCSSEAMQPLPKRLKLENPTAPVSYNSEAGVELLPKVNTELLPYPTEDPTIAKEMNIEMLPKPIEDSTGPKEMEDWSMEWISKLIEDSSNAKEMAESFPGPPEVAIAGYKVVETDGVGSHREEDISFINVIDNARGHMLCPASLKNLQLVVKREKHKLSDPLKIKVNLHTFTSFS
ncbi:hypothetical protein GOBAR_AA29540 [Gossypium barbadense]|uniref:Uncharacterized protein n=1 Tax=Gossypium barbadense TaxID=3634 RepID=A0A2P5WJ84_GOSBA|nr:hypothetical protein GOBAR_AA29540 [Gossypium barbadense]